MVARLIDPSHSMNTPPASSTPTRIGRYRWVICALLFFATAINYIDRQVFSILAPKLQEVIGWTEIEYGYIVFSFHVAYALGLVGVGALMDRIGTRKGFSLAIVFWSLASMGHAFARSAFGFGVARFTLALGEAGNFPGAVKTIAEWFPKKERALATGIFNSGSNVGAIAAPLLVPFIAVKFGWQCGVPYHRCFWVHLAGLLAGPLSAAGGAPAAFGSRARPHSKRSRRIHGQDSVGAVVAAPADVGVFARQVHD